MADFYVSEDRTYTKDFSNLINAANQIGVLDGLEVIANNTWTVSVSGGRALFDNSYMEYPTTSVTVTTADPALDRKDLIFCTPYGSIEIATGIAASIPKPANIGGVKRTMLAEIYVTAGTAGVADSYVTDMREMIYGNKYKDVYEGSIPDTGVCEIFDDEDKPDSADWVKQYNPQKQWGGW